MYTTAWLPGSLLSRLAVLPLLPIGAGLLSACGCRGDVDCAPCPVSGLTLAFDTDSLRTGFRRAEINSAYVVRYALNDFQQPLDTVRQKQPQGLTFYYPGGSRLTLDNMFEARPGQANDFTRYSYRVLLPAAGRQFTITDLDVVGEQSTGCCPCYYNRRRRFVLDGVYVVADGEGATSAPLTR